jgi:hypothetical protein
MSDFTCHVHIGMPKTGTTSIQSRLSQAALTNLRFLPFENANHSPYFANLFENAPWKHRSNTQDNLDKEAVIRRKKPLRKRLSKMLDEAALDQDCQGVIFSGERLATAGRCNAVAMGRFRDFFRGWCSDFQVYGYVRPLASLLASEFQQRLQVGGPPIFDLDWIYPHYTNRFQKHDIVFGVPFVSLRRFERSDLKDGDVVNDLADQLNLTLPPDTSDRENETLTCEATALLHTMKKGGLFELGDRETLISLRQTSYLLKEIKGTKLQFDPAQVQTLLDKYTVDIRWIENRIGASVSCFPSHAEAPVRHEIDLLEIAAASKPRLAELTAALPKYPGAVHPDVLLNHVEKGLTVQRT